MHIQSLIVYLWSNPGSVHLIRVTVRLHERAMLKPPTRQQPRKPALKHHHHQTGGFRSRDHDTFPISNPSQRIVHSLCAGADKKHFKKEILRQRAPCDGQLTIAADFRVKRLGIMPLTALCNFANHQFMNPSRQCVLGHLAFDQGRGLDRD